MIANDAAALHWAMETRAAEKAKRRRSGDSLRDIYMQLIACRVPKADHDALRCVSKRWRAAAERVGLQRLRATCGWTETALIVAGGGDSVFERGESDPTPDRHYQCCLSPAARGP